VQQQPLYDIFSGCPDGSAIWIEAVPGLERAFQRMAELAVQTPGKYFVFSVRGGMLVASIDSDNNSIRAEKYGSVGVGGAGELVFLN
jgi:hypothetical protein